MARRLTALLRHDVRLQHRYGIYAAYAVVVAFYIGVFQAIGARLPEWLKVVVLYTDPSVLGFFFLGALMLLERSENTRVALAMTPIAPKHYFWSKALSLTTVSLVAVGVIAPFLHSRFSAANVTLLLFTVCATSVHYIGLGIPAALRFSTTTSYLIGAAAWLTPIAMPGALAFMQPIATAGLLLPAAAHVALLRHALGDVVLPTAQVVVALATTLLAAALSTWYACSQLARGLGDQDRSSPHTVARAAGPGAASGRAARTNSPLARFLRIASCDLRSIGRDPTLTAATGLSLVPAVAFAVWRNDWDALALSAFGVENITHYAAPVLAVMPAVMLGWVLGFLYLEDRDDGPLQALEVSPLGKEGFFAYRATLIGATCWFIAVASVRLILPNLSWTLGIVIALFVALEAILAGLLLAALARNKVEGLAITKLTNLTALVPLVAISPSPLRLLAGVIPTYWIGELCELSGTRLLPLAPTIVIALVSHGVVGWLLYRWRR